MNRTNGQILGSIIISQEQLAEIAAALERSVIILEHWFYRRASSPARRFFEEYGDFLHYVNGEARPGDASDVWEFSDVCRDSNRIASGKYPDKQGRVPHKGAY